MRQESHTIREWRLPTEIQDVSRKLIPDHTPNQHLVNGFTGSWSMDSPLTSSAEMKTLARCKTYDLVQLVFFRTMREGGGVGGGGGVRNVGLRLRLQQSHVTLVLTALLLWVAPQPWLRLPKKPIATYIIYQLYFVIVKDYNKFGHLLTSQVCYSIVKYSYF